MHANTPGTQTHTPETRTQTPGTRTHTPDIRTQTPDRTQRPDTGYTGVSAAELAMNSYCSTR